MKKQWNDFEHIPNSSPDCLKFDDKHNIVYTICTKCGKRICETEQALRVKVNAWRPVENEMAVD